MNHLKISISERRLYFNANALHFSLLSFHWKKSQQKEKREERRTKREKDKKKKPHFVRLFRKDMQRHEETGRIRQKKREGDATGIGWEGVLHFSLLSFHWKKSQQEEKREE